jgi:hypothetical protein
MEVPRGFDSLHKHPWFARDRENCGRTGGQRRGARPASAGAPQGVRGLQGGLGVRGALGRRTGGARTPRAGAGNVAAPVDSSVSVST